MRGTIRCFQCHMIAALARGAAAAQAAEPAVETEQLKAARGSKRAYLRCSYYFMTP